MLDPSSQLFNLFELAQLIFAGCAGAGLGKAVIQALRQSQQLGHVGGVLLNPLLGKGPCNLCPPRYLHAAHARTSRRQTEVRVVGVSSAVSHNRIVRRSADPMIRRTAGLAYCQKGTQTKRDAHKYDRSSLHADHSRQSQIACRRHLRPSRLNHSAFEQGQIKVGCNLGEWRYFPKPAARGTLNRVEVIFLA
jgi:hypothetical protein